MEKNTYTDTLAFKEKTPLANYGEIEKLLNTFKRTLVRSRVSVILAGMEESTKFNYCWHNDESFFLNLRINIPIQTSPNYVIQMMKEVTSDNLNVIEFELKKEFSYIYDTQKNHRPFCKKLDPEDRIILICGVSPWFDFDEESNAWISNEFYGEMHPFDMFKGGHISSSFKDKLI